MIRACYVFIILIVSTLGGQSQNIVPNGDFENKRGKRYTHRPWRFINTVDRFDMSKRQKMLPMFKKWELPPPHSGDVYVGLRVYADYREFLQIRLPKELEEGKRYYFEMFVRPSDEFNCYVKQLGASFYARRPSYTNDYYIFTYPPQVSYYTDKGIVAENDSTGGWTRISGSFRAKGNEEYLSIGNFSKRKRKDRLKKRQWYIPDYWQLIAYYFVDNIQLYELLETGLRKGEEPMRIEERINTSIELPDSLPYTLEEENYVYRIDREKKLTLEKIRFEFGSDKLIYSSYGDLELVLEYLNTNTSSKLVIIGHTDNVGSEDNNQRLSEKRAKAVHDYFIRNEIGKERLEYIGRGESEPLESNETAQGRSKNRRVEIKLVE